MGGGGSKPTWKSIWTPGDPWPPDRGHYIVQIGGKAIEDICNVMNEVVKDADGRLFDVSELRYSSKKGFRFRALYDNDGFEIQIDPDTLKATLKIRRKAVGSYDFHEPGSIEQMKNDINEKLGSLGEPPLKEGCGVVREIVPVSGGMDSTLLALLHEGADKVYFDYGQQFKEAELLALESMGIKPRIIDIGTQSIDENGVFKSRNFKFFTALREEYPNEDLIVYFGNNRSDENPDLIFDNCQYSINAISEAIDLMYAGPSFEVKSPLYTKRYSKGNISDLLEELAPDNGFVIWCEGASLVPCGECHKCRQMKEHMTYNFWKDRIKVKHDQNPIADIANNLTEI